ncbi:MAG: TIGR01777 family protein [Syntrophus sp. (in: bacteria)]|nr:TIGR01777 family protein [Syntrophus sp. (in: bacteria)]
MVSLISAHRQASTIPAPCTCPWESAARCVMKIFLAGGTGFLGKYLCKAMVQHGHEVTLLVRPAASAGQVEGSIRIVRGDPSARGDWQEHCAGHEAVINLVGASIFRPWTAFARKVIFESRIRSTENIVEAMKHGRQGGKAHLFNASGVGYYGYCKDAMVDEDKPPGSTFLAHLAQSWEATALRAEEAGARVILCRFGIVLGREGGAFQRMLPLAKLHLGAPWGSGEQWFSWIHERDVAGIFSFLLDHEQINGPVNFTSPGPVTNRAMIGILNKTLNKKPFIPGIPGWALRCILGDFSNVFLEGQRAVPGVLKKHGFVFQFPTFTQAAADLIRSNQGRYF